MKTKLLTAGFLLAVSASPITQASFFGVGWDPTGGNNPTIDIQTLDWSPTSFAAKGGNTAILNYVTNTLTGSSLSTDFTVYTHAKLVNVTSFDSFGDTQNTPVPGLNANYEYTIVMSYIESVASVNVNNASANFVANLSRASESFFEIYYGAGALRNAQELSGSGFSDGTLVMKGIIDSTATAATGDFRVTSASTVNLDQAGSGSLANKNNYGIQKTQPGSGHNESVTFKVTDQDTNFFKTPIDLLTIADISQTLPFISVNPSDCFTDSASGVAIGFTVLNDTECNAVHVNGLELDPLAQPLPNTYHGFVPDSGPKNTTLTGVDANGDFIAQTDYNSPLTAKQIPEPSSVLLLGVSLMGLLGFSSRRKMG